MRFLPSTLSLLGGAIIGVAISVSLPASATRNSVGTYTLPSGNPVVSGTTISSTWANNTLGDIAVELTNSLDRQGRGAMLAPLRLQAGTAGAPALTFATDSDTGLYRAGNDDIRFQVDGAQSIQFKAGGTFTPGTATVGEFEVEGESVFAGFSTFSGEATFTAPASFNSGGGALSLRPSSTDHVYLEYYADSDNPTARSGYVGYGGAGTSDMAVVNLMDNGSLRLVTPREIVAESAMRFSSANPSASTAFTNTITPKNIIKAWARIDTVGGGSTTASVVDGFNVSGASVSGSSLTVTLASAMSSTNYAVLVSPFSSVLACSGIHNATTSVLITCRDISGSTLPFPFHNWQTGAARSVYVAVIGAQ